MTTEEYWARYLGLTIQNFCAAGVQVISHAAAFEEYWGAWIFYRDQSLIVSVPKSLMLEYQNQLAGITIDSIQNIESFLNYFISRTDKVIGPAYHGSLQASDLIPCDSSEVSEISFEDAQALSNTGDDLGWEHGDSQEGKIYFGAFVDKRLVAISNYNSLDGLIDSPGIYTHPQYRGHGYGKKVLSAALEHGTKAGLCLIDYQTLCSNTGAIRAAESLGIRPYAKHLAIRFKSEENN